MIKDVDDEYDFEDKDEDIDSITDNKQFKERAFEDTDFEDADFEDTDFEEADEADEETNTKAADVCNRVYELAQEGKKKEAVALLYSAVDNYIKMELNRSIGRNSAAAVDVEDLYQDVYKEIMEHIHTYDPTKKLTTFVKNYIIQARCEYFSRATNIPLYYVQHMNKLKRIDTIYDERGLNQPSLLDYYLETKIPVTTIVNCLAYRKGAESVSLESQSVERESERIVDNMVSEYKDSPEKIFISNEKKSSLLSVLTNLPYEQRIMIGFKFPYMMEVVEPNFFIEHPEMKELFDDTNNLSNKTNNDKKISNKVISDFLGIPIEQVDRMNIISILEDNEDLQNIAGKKKHRKKNKEVATIPVDLALKAIDELEQSDLEEEGLYRL